ncbi:MAG: hypothetical protein KDA61_21090, partial [Planctomycetales bacterium]|nr:hypothetical protein [Planctomycetales bacterium]
MQQPKVLPKAPGLEFVLAAASGVAVVTLQSRQAPMESTLAVPIAYLLVAALLLRADLASAAARTYLLCFLAGLTGLATEGRSLLAMAREVVENSVDPGPVSYAPLLIEAADLLPHLLKPLILGVGLYAACSVFEVEERRAPSIEASSWQKLEAWLKSSGAPDQLRGYLEALHTRAGAILTACEGTGHRLSDIATQLEAVGEAAERSTTGLLRTGASAERL